MWVPSDSPSSSHLHEIIGVHARTREGSQTLRGAFSEQTLLGMEGPLH